MKNFLCAARDTFYTLNLAREQKSLATPGIYGTCLLLEIVHGCLLLYNVDLPIQSCFEICSLNVGKMDHWPEEL